ncbi:MAG: response regulator [Syntrophotaleaceae bacterium]
MKDKIEGCDHISILCVEDEPITRQFLSAIISMKFPEQKVYTADNGREGLELFMKIGAPIVLTDISMPVMDGISMAREIRSFNPEACIIALSAHNSYDCLNGDVDTLFNSYLRKPVSTQLLCDTISDCITDVCRKDF